MSRIADRMTATRRRHRIIDLVHKGVPYKIIGYQVGVSATYVSHVAISIGIRTRRHLIGNTTQTTVALIDADAVYLKSYFGRGWTGELRGVIHKYVKELQNARTTDRLRTNPTPRNSQGLSGNGRREAGLATEVSGGV